jgi:uncharacterized membrane protein YgcG
MRRLVLLTLAAVLLATGVAAAVTNTVDYSVKIAMTTTPSAAAHANLAYGWTYHLDTSAPGNQPNTALSFKVFFAKGIVRNPQAFSSCSQAQIDGHGTFPPQCESAVIGSGEATAYAGSPGQPLSNSVREDLNVRLVNGSGGNLLAVLSSVPGAPVAFSNRVVPGTVVVSGDPYAFAVRFDIPPDLQQQLGLQITFTDWTSTIAVKPAGQTSYLEISECPDTLPVKVIVEFGIPGSPGYPGYPGYPPGTSYPLATVTSEGTTPCANTLYPGYPGYPGGSSGSGGGGGTPGGGDSGGESGGGSTDGTGSGTPGGDTGAPGGTGTPGGGPPPPPPPPGRPRISSAGGSLLLTVDGSGGFVLPGVSVSCPSTSATACDVTATGTQAGGASKVLTLAKAHFRIRPGKRSGVKMRLNKAGTRLLARKHKLRLKVKLLVKSGALTSRRTLTVRLKPKPAKRRH